MNKAKRLAVLVLVFQFSSSFVWSAEGPPEEGAASHGAGTYVGEAVEAVGGRVFGVEGDASDIQYHVIEFTGVSRASSATRSLIIPGWGQHFNNQPVKGNVLFLATAGMLYGAVHLHNKAENSYDDYKAQGQKDSSLYDDYEQHRSQALIFGAATVLLWTLGVIDAYKNAYNPIYSKNPSVDLVLVEKGAEMTVKKSF